MTGRLLVSRRPADLRSVRDWPVGVELKLDWEHRDLLVGERDLGALLADAGIDPDRVESVHLPPGVGGGAKRVEMALTEANRGTIAAFVHDQLDAVPDAHLVAHPPKQFEYATQLELVATLVELTGREFAVENAAVESDWYTPEAIALFGHAGASYDRLDGLYLTVDSAHLPRSGPDERPLALDEAALAELDRRLDAAGLGLPDGFRATMDERLARAAASLPAEDVAGSPYAPLLKTLALAGDRTREVHLNDPVTDGVPAVGTHDERPLLETVLARVVDASAAVVLEPGGLAAPELRERVDALRERLPG